MPDNVESRTDFEDLYALSAEGRRQLFTEARTAYRFSGEPVTDEQLQAIWELLKWAPTASNMSPMRILFVRSDEAKKRLLAHIAPPNQPKSESAPVIAVLARDTHFAEHAPYLCPSVPGLREAFNANAAMREETAAFSATLQAAYFLLAVRATGLAAGPMKGFNAPAVDAEFFPDGDRQTILVVNLGVPAEDAWRERAPRLAYEQVVELV
jgi:3-hydroxypropanoate dehydrogenase